MAVGSKIPSEAELSNKFDVNRNTIRHAIEMLVKKGMLEQQKGVGTFVRGKSSLGRTLALSRTMALSSSRRISNSSSACVA